MKLLALFAAQAAGAGLRVLLVTAAGGLLSATVMVVVNAAAAEQRLGAWYLGCAFLLVLALMFASNRVASARVVALFEDLVRALTRRLGAGLSRAPLQTLEAARDEHGKALGELAVLSSSLPAVVRAVQSAAFLLCVGLTIAQISWKALAIWLVPSLLIARHVWARVPVIENAADRMSASRLAMNARIEDALRGFSQLKLDAAARAEVQAALVASVDEVVAWQDEGRKIGQQVWLGALAIQLGLGIGVAVLGPAKTVGLGPVLGYELMIILSLSWAPLVTLLQSLPALGKAEGAARSVLAALERLEDRAPEPDPIVAEPGFETITLEGLEFEHASHRDGHGPGFRLGPIDLTLRRGELIFLIGGNGSGKTTLLKALLGLYPPTHGRVLWDGQPVDDALRPSYRSLHSAIFTEQHLFEHLYGLTAEREAVTALLRRFEIDREVRFDGEHFGSLDLSSGQRMRLAMVIALLEDRPVHVFDEWTAHQDPAMTRWYYEQLLPELVARGKTVIVVTHDDRYFDRADRRLRLDAGRIAEDTRPAGAGPRA